MTPSKEHLERLHLLLTHAVMGAKEAFDSAAAFGSIDATTAGLLWKAGRSAALADVPAPE